MTPDLKRTTWRHMVAAVCAALLVAACNQGTQTTEEGGGGQQDQGQEAEQAQTSGGETEACKLTTKAEIEAAAGESVNDGIESKGTAGKYDKGEAECTWEYTNKPGTAIAVRYWNDTQAYDVYKPMFPNSEPVSGLGSEAVYAPDLTMITAKVDGKTLQVQAPGRTKDDVVTLTKAAAENL